MTDTAQPSKSSNRDPRYMTLLASIRAALPDLKAHLAACEYRNDPSFFRRHPDRVRRVQAWSKQAVAKLRALSNKPLPPFIAQLAAVGRIGSFHVVRRTRREQAILDTIFRARCLAELLQDLIDCGRRSKRPAHLEFWSKTLCHRRKPWPTSDVR